MDRRQNELRLKIGELEHQGQFIEAFAIQFCLYIHETQNLLETSLSKHELFMVGNAYFMKLFQSESLLSNSNIDTKWELRITLFSNYSCVHKSKHNYFNALKYVEKAMKIENKLQIESVTTRLNACAILSELKQHAKAFKYASKAVSAVKKGLKEESTSVKLYMLASLSYFSMGTQLEHLVKYEQALTAYVAAKHFNSLLGSETVSTKDLETAILDIESRLQHRATNTLCESLSRASRTRHSEWSVKPSAPSKGKIRKPTFAHVYRCHC